MIRRLFLIFGLSILLAGCSLRAGERPYFVEAVESVQAVAIVPADVHVSKKRSSDERILGGSSFVEESAGAL